MDKITLTPLKQINHSKGDIYHAMKASDIGFNGFGEAYFSTIKQKDIKGWKKHQEMTLNLIVINGAIRFVVFDEIDFFEVILSKDNYQRLTIPPNKWLAFQGLDAHNTLLNIANIEHQPDEAINQALSTFNYEW